ncbi:MAG: ATP-dependent 6-phosphofructokinase [Chitinivibrionales bacterium]
METDFRIKSIGERGVKSPVKLSKVMDDFIANYVDDKSCIHRTIIENRDQVDEDHVQKRLLERAGPRERIFFEPEKVHAGVVTCGGLCPGLNDVIRAIVMGLWYRYGVKRISGIRYGYKGLIREYGYQPAALNPEVVLDIHRKGGTMLSSSRGGGDRVTEIVDTIERLGINILFTIGGDGTQKGALAISKEAVRRGINLSVTGVPKTIDNDLSYIDKSFGFETAVGKACDSIDAAHVEAKGAVNGIGVVKVMGRQSGFIAAHTALAINDVNYVLIPEVPFDLYGENGLLSHLKKRLDRRGHAVILIAEGAGQEMLESRGDKDPSGNPELGDIGVFISESIKSYFNKMDYHINLKYIDPGYIIRGAPANPADSLYCARLGTNAVHAAMAGKTQLLMSLFNNHYVHIPMEMAISRKNMVDPESSMWRDVVEATGQPALMKNS